jgi:NitT/TauT family transport system substrate-binding protein
VILLALLAGLAAACAAPAQSTARDASAPAGTAPPSGSAAAPLASAPTVARAAPPEPLPAPLKVHMGSVGSIGDGPIYIALDRGYFAELGLDVEDVRFDAATRMMAPLAAGQLDLVSAAITAGLFNAVARDIDVRMVADRGVLMPGFGPSGLAVRQDLWDSGAVRTLADLRERRVGVAGAVAGSAFVLWLGYALEGRGLTLADLEVEDIAIPETNAALANRNLDAGMQIEPQLSLGVANGTFSVLQRADELYPDQQSAFVLYAADFARTQPEAGRRWMVAYLRGVRDYMDAFTRDRDRDDVAAILARNTSVRDLAIFRRMVPNYIDPNGRLNVRNLIESQDWFVAHGYIPQKADVAALVDSQFADYAVSVLGEYR